MTMIKNQKIEIMPPYDDTKNVYYEEISTFSAKDVYYSVPRTVPLHWHDGYLEIELILDGTIFYNFNGTEYIMEKGNLIVCSQTDFHSMEASGAARVLKNQFSYDFLDEKLISYFSEKNNLHYKFTDDEFVCIYTLGKWLEKLSENKNEENNNSAKHIISTILTQTISRTNSNESNKTPPFIQSIIQYTNNNLSQKLTIQSVAKYFNLSTGHFGKVFKNNMDISYNEYVNRIRLRKVCSLINSSSMSVKEIAYRCGFSSLEYFYYTFKKYYGITPLQYKKK